MAGERRHLLFLRIQLLFLALETTRLDQSWAPLGFTANSLSADTTKNSDKGGR